MSNIDIVGEYIAATPASAVAFERAKDIFPGGVTHDVRYILPHPIFVTHARGSRKWDADGREYVDYQGGHGALILGHAHPQVNERIAEQLARGTHYGANHELEIRWAELIREMVPSAERVRFTGSGTESTLMAFRIARAATGRRLLLRLRGHFHGWHDHVAFGVVSHYDGTPTPGVLEELAENVVLVEPNDEADLERVVAEHSADIAAAILEPTGSIYGQVPLRPAFVQRLRDLTKHNGIVLIFDEVVTGFRVAPGGAQQALGITPDLTTLAKILAGGLPGGAVVGRQDLLEHLDPETAQLKKFEKIGHQGTFNANPLSAAAGIATLELLKDGKLIATTQAYAARVREGAKRIFVEEGLPWGSYGSFTGFHFFLNPNGLDLSAESFDAEAMPARDLRVVRNGPLNVKFRLAMRLHGVDLSAWPGGPCSAVHDDADLDRTLTALKASIADLRAEGLLP